eukprot:9180627-Pyramimonas_sp.AAC.1
MTYIAGRPNAKLVFFSGRSSKRSRENFTTNPTHIHLYSLSRRNPPFFENAIRTRRTPAHRVRMRTLPPKPSAHPPWRPRAARRLR